MTDKLSGAFQGCPHHEDDYEACIQHSGTAPCGVEEERDRFSRMFANACANLGAVQEALGNEDVPEVIGLEPQLVKKLRAERDALAVEVKRHRAAQANYGGRYWENRCKDAEELGDALAALLEEARQAYAGPGHLSRLLKAGHVLNQVPETSLTRRDAQVAAEAWRESAKRLQQAIDYIEEKHDSNPNYPAVSYDAIAEYAVDMERYADKLSRQAEGSAQ